jgi:hypothetical protein
MIHIDEVYYDILVQKHSKISSISRINASLDSEVEETTLSQKLESSYLSSLRAAVTVGLVCCNSRCLELVLKFYLDRIKNVTI